jgi:multidrug resistance efflux pump
MGLRPITHIRPDESDQETRAAAIQAFQELIGPCIQQGKNGAIEVGPAGTDADAQFCLITLLRNEGEVVAASAVITRCRDVERAQQRLMSMELVAGYFDLYTLRRSSEQARQIAQSHQHVLQLATAEGFVSAAKNLCNELATRTSASRVSIGWLKGNRIRVKALSHTEEFDKKQELIVQLERAMEECHDQDAIVQHDPEGGGTDNVTREAQALSRAQGGNTVISLPLRRQGQGTGQGGTSEIIGVMTLEFSPGTKLGPQAATGLSIAADLLAPQLYDRYQNDRWLITKAAISTRETAKLAIGPKHMLAKTVIVLVIAAGAFVCLYQPMYHVTARFQFLPIEKRVIDPPYEGYIKDVFVHPGDAVKAGQELVRLDTTDLDLKLAEHKANAAKYRGEEQMYRVQRGQNGLPQTAQAEVAALQAVAEEKTAAYIQQQVDRATIKAPIDGVILQGDLQYKLGAPVKPGDALIELAKQQDLKAELQVADRDIQFVKAGQEGKLATSSLPGNKYPFRVQTVVPLGKPVEGDNVYQVFAQLAPDSSNWPKDATGAPLNPTWLPGMEGEAKVAIEPRPLVWIWTHKFTEWVRLKTWTWPIIGG